MHAKNTKEFSHKNEASQEDSKDICVPRKRRGRGLILCEACVQEGENNLGWFVGKCNEVLLRKVGERGTVKTDEAKEPREYKKNAKHETKQMEREAQVRLTDTWKSLALPSDLN